MYMQSCFLFYIYTISQILNKTRMFHISFNLHLRLCNWLKSVLSLHLFLYTPTLRYSSDMDFLLKSLLINPVINEYPHPLIACSTLQHSQETLPQSASYCRHTNLLQTLFIFMSHII